MERSPFVGTGCTKAYFQHEGKIDVDRQRQKSLTRQGVCTEAFFKDNRRHSIRSISLLRVEAREGMENIIMKNW